MAGVTLIELLVVIFIFMIITSITVFNYSKFNSSLSIQNLSDDIALSIRKAQGFAIGVRGLGNSFGEAYGVHFTSNPNNTSLEGSNTSFVLFADINSVAQNQNKYNYDDSNLCGKPTINNECLEVLSIISADKIDKIFLNNEITPISNNATVDILFKRPNPEPIFCYRSGPNSLGCDNVIISSIKIKIVNITNPLIFKIITISNNGQISVSNDEN